ncbi:hypothetical protein SDC9_89987 [bioreactor metagenome]|uniref:Uncharacterized protein n=1 Tax=bioreactor metagenome TaxID=1076179 RepID=A0A645A0G3_9ZZZZ
MRDLSISEIDALSSAISSSTISSKLFDISINRGTVSVYGFILDDLPNKPKKDMTSFTQAIQTSLEGPIPACNPPALDVVSSLNFAVASFNANK